MTPSRSMLTACHYNAQVGSDELGSPSNKGLPADAGFDAVIPCGVDGWSSYGHDATRASASGGCVIGNPTLLWRYSPTPPTGAETLFVYNAIARSDAVFVAWGVTGYPFGVTQALDRVSSEGTFVWSFVPGYGDAAKGYWPSMGLGGVAYASDGLYWIDDSSGNRSMTTASITGDKPRSTISTFLWSTIGLSTVRNCL